ncbi:hypothetical protein NC652_035158 [Populus alba x Populus x berolinensis]|nr:hypothetical protein NC652_035158 [Populus alba x Populus x berolinensis]
MELKVLPKAGVESCIQLAPLPHRDKGDSFDGLRVGASASTKRARSPLPILELNQDRTPRSNHIYRGPQSLGFAETPSKITSSPSLGIPTKALIITKEPKLGTSQSPGLVHFPNFTSFVSCQFKDTDVSSPADLGEYCLIGFIAGKFPGYVSLSNYIGKNWAHHANFTMHDSGWLIFAFPTKREMLEILGGGPYYVFSRPLILQVMPDFFDFKPNARFL